VNRTFMLPLAVLKFVQEGSTNVYEYETIFVHSGGTSAAKEPGHFEVRTSSSQVTRMHFFPQNKTNETVSGHIW